LDDITIFTQHWLPDDPPRAVVMISHGVGEHGGRYAHVAAYLTAHGYAVYAIDYRGHGQSGGERVMIDDYEDYATDLRAYFEQVRAAHPGLPVFLYGHSMGSLIALLFAFRWGDDLAGLITTGTSLKPIALNRMTGPLIETAGSVVPQVRLIPVPTDTLSRDPAVGQRYRDDPLVYHRALPMRAIRALARAARTCTASLPALRMPYLVLHGGADSLTRVGAVDIIRQTCGSPDLTVKVYDGLYHEIHNEPEQEQVFHDMVAWLDQHTPDRSGS
jgi:alpha-beta hydrolase superfamily lysophospholipase